MKTLTVIPYEPGHLLQLADLRAEMGPYYQTREHAEAFYRCGPACSFFYQEELLACGGLGIMWPGMAKAWMYTTQAVENHRVAFFKTFHDKVVSLFAAYALHRVETEVLLDAPNSWHLWMLSLGFQIETLKKKYGPNKESYIAYVWIQED